MRCGGTGGPGATKRTARWTAGCDLCPGGLSAGSLCVVGPWVGVVEGRDWREGRDLAMACRWLCVRWWTLACCAVCTTAHGRTDRGAYMVGGVVP